MKKEDLVKLGLDEATAQKVAAASEEELKGFVPKVQLDEAMEAKKTLDSQIKDRDKQLETLKKSTGDAAELQKKIEELQTANKTAKTDYETKLKDVQLTNAIKLAVAADAQDVDLVAGLFDKSKLILGDDGKITGLDDQLKTLKESKAFLFKQGKPPAYNPNGGDGGNPAQNPFKKETFNLTEQGKLLKENPAQAKALAAEAGVTI